MGQRSPVQSFKLDVSKMLTVADLIHSELAPLQDISQALTMGQRKVRCLREWGCMANILKGSRSTTELYPYIKRLRSTNKWLQVLQLVHYWLCRNNPILSYVAHGYAGQEKFTVEELNRNLVERDVLSGISEKNIRKALNVTLNSLTDPKGLGDLGLVQRITQGSTRYEVHSQPPEPLVAAYIIYTNWPPNTAKVAINEIVSGRNSLGRIFFLDETQVMTLLRDLEARGFVKIETVASLNQIGINPKLTPHDFLDMLINEARQ